MTAMLKPIHKERIMGKIILAVTALIMVGVSGCATQQESAKQPQPGEQTAWKPITDPSVSDNMFAKNPLFAGKSNVYVSSMEIDIGKLTAEGPAANSVKNYLVTAGKLDGSATKPFLSKTFQDDIVVEFQANANSGWNLSKDGVHILSEEINAEKNKASVKAKVIFEGGNPPTFMSRERTYTLVLEGGAWKISGIVPAPKRDGPGMVPLSR
jgi:hypothetical protein